MGASEFPDVETASEGYARRFSGAVGAWLLDVQRRAVRELLRDLPAGSRILDVGGGHAQLVPLFIEAGYETVVLGSGSEAGARLAPYLREGALRFEVGRLVPLPFEAGSFDVVAGIRLLPHLAGWRDFLAEACRVARRCVIIDYPSIRGVNRFAGATFAWKKRAEGNTRPFALFRPAEIAEAFESSGYRVREARAQFLLPLVLHRIHRSPALGRALEAPGRLIGLTRVWGSPILVRADRRAPLVRP